MSIELHPRTEIRAGNVYMDDGFRANILWQQRFDRLNLRFVQK
ncbi:hypothetical protein [Nocardia acidivorans]|nr:hypothetical protein [Nocardia acidivorans]